MTPLQSSFNILPSPIYHAPPGLCHIRIQGRGQERVKTRLGLLLPASCATGWPLHAEWPRSHLQRAPIVTSIYSYLEKKSTNAFSFFKRDASAFTLMNLERRHRNTQSFYLHDIGICVFISSLTGVLIILHKSPNFSEYCEYQCISMSRLENSTADPSPELGSCVWSSCSKYEVS